jgi:hypothetical protein
LYKAYNYLQFVQNAKAYKAYLKEEMKKKKNFNFVTSNIDLNIDDDDGDVNDSDNRSSIPPNFVTSSNFVPSTTLNVVLTTNQSIVPALPPTFEISFLSTAYSPSLPSTSCTPPNHFSLTEEQE